MTRGKVRRWIDLIAALLAAKGPVTFAEIAKRVPAYLVDGKVPDGAAASRLSTGVSRTRQGPRVSSTRGAPATRATLTFACVAAWLRTAKNEPSETFACSSFTPPFA